MSTTKHVNKHFFCYYASNVPNLLILYVINHIEKNKKKKGRRKERKKKKSEINHRPVSAMNLNGIHSSGRGIIKFRAAMQGAATFAVVHIFYALSVYREGWSRSRAIIGLAVTLTLDFSIKV